MKELAKMKPLISPISTNWFDHQMFYVFQNGQVRGHLVDVSYNSY